MMTDSIKNRADFLFTGAKVQIKSYFRDGLTQIITELMILFKQINPVEELPETCLAKALEAPCRLFDGALLVQIRLGIALVGIADHLFLQGVWLVLSVRRQGQALGLDLFAGDARPRMALTDLRMAHEALLTQEASANDAMTDIGLCAEALDPWGVTLVDADVMQHRRLLQELRIQAQLGMLPGYQQATVCHLSAVG